MFRLAVPASDRLWPLPVIRRMAERLRLRAADTAMVRDLQQLDETVLHDVGLRPHEVAAAADLLEPWGLAVLRSLRGEGYASPGRTLRLQAMGRQA